MGYPGKRKWNVRPATSSALRYGLAIVSVAGALGLAYTFLYFHLPQPFAAFALSAIAITFWYGGAKPGILASVLAALIRSYIFTPEISTVSGVAYDLVFLLFALLMVQVTRARQNLEMRVAERTAELTRTTEDLKREIVERKRAAAELRQSKAYLTEAQSLSHTGSFGWRPSTGEIIWSDETFRIMGYDSASTPTVEVVENRTHPEDRALLHEVLAQAAREKKAFAFEHRLMMPDDGTVKYVRVVGHPLTNDESGDYEFVGAVTDITDRKRAEEALQRSEGYLSQAQRLTQSGSWAWNAHTGTRFWSQETFRIFGYDPETVEPTWSDILERVHPEDRTAIVQKAITEATLKQDSEFDWRIVLPDGTVKHLHSIAHPVLDESGEITEVVGTLMDVSERKRAEALRNGESHILEMIARDAPLTEILEQLVRVLEGQFAGLLCSVLLLDKDGQHTRHGAGPSLPKAYIKAIDGLPIGPNAGSCGTAMYRKEPVVVTDILQDPLWEPYRAAAEPHGFRACWSTPILSPSGKALGSFAMYYREPRSPSQAESHALEMATHIAGIAIERKRTHRQLRRSEAYLAEAQKLSHSGSWAFNDREALYWSEENFR
ncbi:MAG TPA: PAS domain-containing protein, partial [Candidatus Sulfotelmatobacter sp.]|nr:PAS domain-containing protein [Candidatus Sulfotelmatobacter sp.]